MATVIVPFRGRAAKQRLELDDETRAALAHAMLEDVVAACAEIGRTLVVTPEDAPAPRGAELVADPGRGQGAAVEAALAEVDAGPVAVVNADLPCATTRDLLSLLGCVPEGGLAVVRAADGTTNALALSSPSLFEPVYGPRSAARFLALAPSREVEIPNLADDVDSLADLERLELRLGPHSSAVLEDLRAGLAG